MNVIYLHRETRNPNGEDRKIDIAGMTGVLEALYEQSIQAVSSTSTWASEIDGVVGRVTEPEAITADLHAALGDARKKLAGLRVAIDRIKSPASGRTVR